MVLLSEGKTNIREQDTLMEVRHSRNAGIHIVPIGVSFNDHHLLKSIATDEIRGVFLHEEFQPLENVSEPLRDYVMDGL